MVVYLAKNHYEHYSPRMVPTNPTCSWSNRTELRLTSFMTQCRDVMHDAVTKARSVSVGLSVTLINYVETATTSSFVRLSRSLIDSFS